MTRTKRNSPESKALNLAVAACLARGLSDEAIAAELSVSLQTAKARRRALGVMRYGGRKRPVVRLTDAQREEAGRLIPAACRRAMAMLAGTVTRSGADPLDLYQSAALALVDLYTHYDPERCGGSLRDFLFARACSAIRDAIRRGRVLRGLGAGAERPVFVPLSDSAGRGHTLADTLPGPDRAPGPDLGELCYPEYLRAQFPAWQWRVLRAVAETDSQAAAATAAGVSIHTVEAAVKLARRRFAREEPTNEGE